ncbi:aspartate aminotransferase family protein [Aestuariimicrobium soli]|uniref:aspartate aminotransferase family protein n=1 Tax=Aestuariimicrobium soli TaxID=2035834 RepID=UPI003EBD81BE
MDRTRSLALAERARRVIPGGVNSSTRNLGAPHAIVGAEGAHVTDADGNRYLDYHAAFGAMLLGHCEPEIEQAVTEASARFDLSGFGVSELEVELSEAVVAEIPSVEQMFTLSSGSEAVAYGLRIARTATDRDLIIKVQGGFHGWSDSVARNVISAPDKAFGWDPLGTGMSRTVLEQTLIAEYNDIATVEQLFADHPEQIAAVIVEPIPHNVGALLPTDDFLAKLREVTTREGALLVFDEVITGFRHALGGYQSICGVTPDLTTFGKAMGNGRAIAGLGGRLDVMRHADQTQGGTVVVMGTFNGNQSAAAAALATIGHLRSNPDFYERTHRLGQRLRAGLNAIFDEAQVAGVAAGFGGTFSPYFIPGEPTSYRALMANDTAASLAFNRGLIERGFLLIPMALKRSHISGRHTDADIDATLEAARDVVAEMVAAGTAPRR